MQIRFVNPDSPEAAALFQTAVQRIQLPVLGLIVKVNADDQVVNFDFVETDTIKALALAQALGDAPPVNP